MTDYIEIAIKLIIGLSVLNVWLFRADKSTPWRGAGASNLKEEFKAYGLSEGMMKIVGGIKMTLSVLILLSIFYPGVERIGAIGMAIMMAGAISMHIRVKDDLKRSLPAFLFMSLSLVILYL